MMASCPMTDICVIFTMFRVCSKIFSFSSFSFYNSSEGVTVHFLSLYTRALRLRVLYVPLASNMSRKWDLNSDSPTSVHVPNQYATQPL